MTFSGGFPRSWPRLNRAQSLAATSPGQRRGHPRELADRGTPGRRTPGDAFRNAHLAAGRPAATGVIEGA